jgi:hypothetical protein
MYEWFSIVLYSDTSPPSTQTMILTNLILHYVRKLLFESGLLFFYSGTGSWEHFVFPIETRVEMAFPIVAPTGPRDHDLHAILSISKLSGSAILEKSLKTFFSNINQCKSSFHYRDPTWPQGVLCIMTENAYVNLPFIWWILRSLSKNSSV